MRPRSATTSTTPRHAHVVHVNTAKRHSALALPCTFLLTTKHRPSGTHEKSLDGYRHLGELKALSQRNISVEERARRIQLDLDQNAKDLGARDPRSKVHAEMKVSWH